ncbi:spore germination protein [Clostridium neuense]|uniref:Spore germination protein n=1 Tax=Clostridium neuense TaxID=1728934 RepID=A0ABW8TA98_9CLOT
MQLNKIQDYIKNNSDGAVLTVGSELTLYFLKPLTKFDEIITKIQIPFMKDKESFDVYLKSLSNIIDQKDAIKYLVKGYVIGEYKNKTLAIFGFSKTEARAIGEAIKESSFEGGLEAFIEDLSVNLNLIRSLYRTNELVVNIIPIGDKDQKQVALVYNKNSVDTDILSTLTKELSEINVPTIGALSELQQILIKNQYIFPRLLTTERPDRVIHSIDSGRVAIFLEGTAVAALAPTTFHDYFSTVDDRYLLPVPAVFLIVIRYLALVISIIMPASYVAFVAYNPEVFRVQLALSIAGSRQGVPYASYIEVSFMLLMMEFLIEASLRLPKTIGQTATTVGGLILGQAMTEASLASEVMIIIVSSVAISNFVIPATSMSLSIRILKYYVLLLTIIGGLMGFIAALMTIIFYMTSLNSFSTPFFNPANIPISRLKSIFGKVK